MRNQDWKHLLSAPQPDDHIVQLYQDGEFYCDAISHFASEGLIRGESIILVATAPNWVNISAQLEGKGFDLPALFDRGQLTLLDADETLPKFMRNGMPDGTIFKPLASKTIEQARGAGKYSRVRWWGEMVNVLYVEGNGRGSNQLEQFFDQVAHEESVAILCSFLMDQYDPAIYEEAFINVCATHSNVIPAKDYQIHRDAVNVAIEQIIGPIEGKLLQSLVSWRGTNAMPPSQSMLLWIKDTIPDRFCDVLESAKAYEKGTLH